MKTAATEENISKARNELIEEHENVTVEAIRDRIGGGSYNTIMEILHKINAQETAACINQPDPDEDQVLTEQTMPLVRALYQVCKKRADTIAMCNYKGLELISKEINEKAAKLDEIEEIYDSRAQINEAEVKRLTTENEALKEQNKLLKDSLQEARDSLKEARDTLKETRDSLKEAHDSLKEAREDLKRQQILEQGYEEIKKQISVLSNSKQEQIKNQTKAE